MVPNFVSYVLPNIISIGLQLKKLPQKYKGLLFIETQCSKISTVKTSGLFDDVVFAFESQHPQSVSGLSLIALLALLIQ